MKATIQNKKIELISTGEKQSIKKGLKDAKAGKLNSHSKARKVYEKWLD